jgi:flagellar biosynthesis chaperone FliJ
VTRRNVGKYPLLAAKRVRGTAKDEAARLLSERRLELAEEEEKLRRLEMRRAVLAQEFETASESLFETDSGVLDVGEIDRRRGAIQFLGSRVKDCNDEVASQEDHARLAQERVDEALDALVEAARDLEVIEKHEGEWLAERRREGKRREERELQELSTHGHSARLRATSEEES